MKTPKKLLTIAAMSMLGMVLGMNEASASPITTQFTAGDLILGFNSSYGTGFGYETLIDLGTPTSSDLAPSSITLTSSQLSALSSEYGSGWSTNGYISVAVFGGTVDGTTKEAWMNAPSSSLNTKNSIGAIPNNSGTKTISQSLNTFQGLAVGIDSLYNNGSTTSGSITSGGNTFATTQYSISSQSFSWSTPDNGSWNNALLSPLAVTLNGAISLDVYYYDTTGLANQVGTVSFDGLNNITVNSVPEPTTNALIIAGLAMMIIIARRKLNTNLPSRQS